MQTRFIPSFVVLSVVVAMLASYVALNLAHSINATKGRARAYWLAGGALAMGVGIWSMHFIGMLAFEMPGMEMAYDVPLMTLSVVVAVGASAIALFIVGQASVPMTSLIAGGVAMAAAIAGMHYIGMYSMRMAARIVWNPYLVSLSILIALVASFAALQISIRLRTKPDRFLQLSLASILMGFAISGMHYTGMVAATFVHDVPFVVATSSLLVSDGLAAAVLTGTLLILGLALTGSVAQRLWALKARQTQEVLSTSEEKFRLLVEAVKDYAIFMLDTQGRVTTWNTGAERITGFKEFEIVGKLVSTLYPPSDAGGATPEKELRIARMEGHYEAEDRRMRKDGSRFWANIVVSPLYDSAGQLHGFSKVIRDITQLKVVEEQLRNSNEELEKRVRERTLSLQERESQLRMITNSLPVLIAQVDALEALQFANEAFCNWFLIPPGEARGRSFREILGERYPANAPYIRRALSGEVASYERHSVSGSNDAILSITFVPEFDEQGSVKGFILLASDITKHKQIEAELKAAKEAADVANATKSAFLANMSHEIRTPLGAVLGFSELMLNSELTPSERFNNFEIIKRNGKLLSNIINDILDLSKVEAGKLEIESASVHFLDLLNEIGSLLNLEATGKGISLTMTSEGVLPSVIRTDPTRLRQILFNVIGNAIKFTEKGNVSVCVKLVPGAAGAMQLAFIVKDTGTGIKPEQIERLFSPFTQADPSTTRRFGGTGLGLVLSKELAIALGGDVVLKQSQPGEGSTFVVTIDPGHGSEVLFESSQKQERNIVPISKIAPNPTFTRLKILIVDDSPDNQALIKKLLTLVGASVETANNGREGVRKALQGDFSMILMDLQMPEMDGYEATRELRRQGYSRPIIALTAHAMKEERRKCLENGFDDHLTKPIDRESLLHALSEYSA